MSIPDFISRLTDYFMRHGLGATIRRARVALKRMLFANRMVVFYCDLSTQTFPALTISASFRIDRLRNVAELRRQDLEVMLSLWNSKLARRNMEQRFAKGASLWLLESGDQLAAYCWTIKGKAIAPYYFPMASHDVQLFDFYVLPRFRGGAVLWFLISSILQALKAEGGARAYGDAAEWNQASLAFYKMTPFRPLGMARAFTVFGHRFTTWTDCRKRRPLPQRKDKRHKAPAMVSSHERRTSGEGLSGR